MASEAKDTVASIMNKTVRSISSKATVDAALRAMAEYDTGGLVIVEDGAPVGIVTERDIIRKIIRKNWKGFDEPVFDVASKHLITVPPNMEIWKAFTLIVRKKIRRLPVEDHGKLVGVVNEWDLFRWAVRVFYEPDIPAELAKLLTQRS